MNEDKVQAVVVSCTRGRVSAEVNSYHNTTMQEKVHAQSLKDNRGQLILLEKRKPYLLLIREITLLSLRYVEVFHTTSSPLTW